MHNDIDLKQHIRSIPDFPKPGILFYDISTLLAHAKAWHTAIERLADRLRPHKPDLLAGIESRGFQRVVLVDDLLATGGTMAAAVQLLESVGAYVPTAACIIELTFLEGRKKLKVPVETLLEYDS